MTIKTPCPNCGRALEIPEDFNSCVCSECGSAFDLRRFGGAIELAPANGPSAEPRNLDNEVASAVEKREERGTVLETISVLDEEAERIREDIVALHSKEVGKPLELGCALFGIFGLAITIMAVFATVGRSYFGGGLFYLTLSLVLLAGGYRIKMKMARDANKSKIKDQRSELEALLPRIEAEQERLKGLLTVVPADPPKTAGQNGTHTRLL